MKTSAILSPRGYAAVKYDEIPLQSYKEVLTYDSVSGNFYWIDSRKGNAVIGAKAGLTNERGYIRIFVFKKTVYAHRLAWAFLTGKWPKEQIDHKNGIRSDNAAHNLREAAACENLQNRRKFSTGNKSSGVLGAVWVKDKKRWRARISANGATKFIGYFKTAEEAHEAYVEKKRVLHPFNTI